MVQPKPEAKYVVFYCLDTDAQGTHFNEIGGGKGGYWEDLGYAWYAGI